MTIFLYYTLITLSAFFLLFALRRPEGIYQFPALFSGAFLFSIVPQLWNHVYHPGRLPQIVYESHGVEYGILMCILCLVAGNLGYGTPIRRLPRWHLRLPQISDRHLIPTGLLLAVIGLYGALSLDRMAGGMGARFTGGGHYDLSWTGMTVVYSYISAGIVLGFLLCLNAALSKASLTRWTIVAATAVYPVLSIIFLGRRTMVFRMALFVAGTLWFRKRWAPPRIAVVAAMVLGGIAIITLDAYRSYAVRTGDLRGAFAQVDFREELLSYAEGGHQEGMDNLIIGIPARMHAGSFTLGSSIWNSLVNSLVPAVFVGRSLKSAMVFRVGKNNSDIFHQFAGVDPAFGAFSTGPYAVFAEWHFLGCLFYFLLARFFRRLWVGSMQPHAMTLQILYIASLLFVPLFVVDSHSATFSRTVFVWLLLIVGVFVSTKVLGVRHNRARAIVYRSAATLPN